MKKFTYFIFLAILSVTILGVAYYQYSSKHMPEKVINSQKTIINIDSLRFTFKISIMAQKGLSSYLAAVSQKNPDLYTQAIDYFDAAAAFADPALLDNDSFSRDALLLIEKISTELENNKLTPTQEALHQLENHVHLLSKLSEQEERESWLNIQKNYIEFKTHEYKVIQLYETITIAFLAFFLIAILLTIRQQRLIKQNRKQQAELHHQAFFDPLTGIANRKNLEKTLDEKIEQAQHNQHSFYIALIDLDDFKNINDLLGHYAGDQLLQKTVSIFRKMIRHDDIFGRLGGDEFLIIFNEYTSHHQLIATLNQIKQAFNNPILVDGNEFKITISIGVACYPKDVCAETSQITQHLIKSADIAMYEAKNRGKNQFHFYDAQLEARIQLEHKMDKEIERAIELNEFELYYQPQIDAKSQRVVGAEALIRWHHPQKGLTMPGEFIEFIEKGYHTSQFGEWVISNAIKQQKIWRNKGMLIPLSVNLSVKHILSPNFFQRISGLIEETGADLQQLVFEITEYELIQSQELAIHDLNKLQQNGFKFHLDDFGTGYSSLSYLSQLPVEAIKIDKSFIDYIAPGREKQNLVEAIIHIGDTLNKDIIAEGVETQYQVEFLRNSGCETLQGYYYSKPITANDFERFYLERKK